ncbi:MAG TPA: TetR/AcrR family transcriptional regulator [Epulopiscium sp.]|nr:TetR/AcrR family transcriptional regulator [Candidatus Epulonipiscium sp.]
MNEKPYHHGNLQTELIEEGLALINEEGIANFSLRKLAKRVKVTPTACYNHYANKEELLDSMKHYVTERFSNALLEGSECENQRETAIAMGKAYVNFFAKNPHYFSFIYDNEDYSIELTENDFTGDYKAFCIFKEIATVCMEVYNIPKSSHRNNLIAMWSMVHGLAAMANMKGFSYDGDWEELTEIILQTKLSLC